MQTSFILLLSAFFEFGIHAQNIPPPAVPKNTKKIYGCKIISKQVNNGRNISWKASPISAKVPELIINSLDLSGRSGNHDGMQIENFSEEFQVRHLMPLPKSYDLREIYQNCPSLNQITDQGCGCKASWAIAPASALSDRYCIFHNGEMKPIISADDILTCCTYCKKGHGCKGGASLWAWVYLQHSGAVSEGCLNYQIPPCVGETPTSIYKTLNCRRKCDLSHDVGHHLQFKSLKSYAHKNSTVEILMRDIFDNGPLTTDMHVYEDFFCYKSGIYKHVMGQQFSVHTVKLIGWGEEDGVKYWLAANSWGTEWGEKGFFKIERGTNESNVENAMLGGIPWHHYRRSIANKVKQ